MSSFSRNDIVLVRVPFSDFTGSKVRPVVVVNGPHRSRDMIAVGLTSRTSGLLQGEFGLADWARSGLNVATAAKRALFTIDESLPLKRVGSLSTADAQTLDASLKHWLGL
jgi:mRNA interferase MazF